MLEAFRKGTTNLERLLNDEPANVETGSVELITFSYVNLADATLMYSAWLSKHGKINAALVTFPSFLTSALVAGSGVPVPAMNALVRTMSSTVIDANVDAPVVEVATTFGIRRDWSITRAEFDDQGVEKPNTRREYDLYETTADFVGLFTSAPAAPP